MSIAGIYPIGHKGPQLSDREVALLAALPDQGRESRGATHADLRAAVIALVERYDFSLMLEVTETGFVAVIASDLRVVANKRGSGDETFYCQAEDEELVRKLAEEIARVCGPQLVLPSGADDGVLVIAGN